MNKFILAIGLLFTLTAYCYANDNGLTFTSTEDKNRFTTFTKEVRCIVCQNQNLADSDAPIANDLRAKIYELILHKKSDAEINDYLVRRYGEFILLRPRINKLTFLLWSFPFISLLAISLFLFGLRRKSRA